MSGGRSAAPTLLSAFTGAGGLDLGFHRAGFRILGCIERDPCAGETVRLNELGPLLAQSDIADVARTLTPQRLGIRPQQLGALVGAPPCQPFSKAAQWASAGRAGLNDKRSSCVWAFFELAARFLPAVIVLENVPGFVTGKTSALKTIRHLIAEIDREHGTSYRLYHTRLNACDYGVPQRRERAILVALRDGGEFEWPKPTHVEAPVRAYDAIGEVVLSEIPLPRGKWAGLLPTIPEGANYMYHTPGGGGRSLFGRRTRFWSFLLKLAKDKPSWTLQAHPGPATGPFHWSGRPLAIEEMLRLQSFPTEWKLSGTRTDRVRQVGNATPPLLAEVIGRAIGAQVFGLRYKDRPTLTITRKTRIPPAAEVSPVPESLHHLEGEHEPHAGVGKGPKPIVATASS